MAEPIGYIDVDGKGNLAPVYAKNGMPSVGKDTYGKRVIPKQKEVVSLPKANSREQYEAEKKAGGPLTDLSFEEWKALD